MGRDILLNKDQMWNVRHGLHAVVPCKIGELWDEQRRVFIVGKNEYGYTPMEMVVRCPHGHKGDMIDARTRYYPRLGKRAVRIDKVDVEQAVGGAWYWIVTIIAYRSEHG
jgi:hypothetical protein